LLSLSIFGSHYLRSASTSRQNEVGFEGIGGKAGQMEMQMEKEREEEERGQTLHRSFSGIPSMTLGT
jgi:hypothetical protein